MMKKIFIAAGAAFAAFAVGLIGAFFLLPMVAPDMAVSLVYPDADTVSAESHAETAGDVHPAADDELPPETLDSLAAEANVQVDTTITADSTLLLALKPGMVTIEEDSLTSLRSELREIMRAKESLRTQLSEREVEIGNLQQRAEDMSELSATLTRMDDRELAPILRGLDQASLRVLFAESTGRNRTRILQAMPSDRAATFIDELVDGTPTIPESD